MTTEFQPKPKVTCCKEFNDELVVWMNPSYDWSRKAWCIKQPEWYGEIDYHPIKHCPWCGAKLPEN